MKVRVIKKCFYNGAIQQEGDVFDFPKSKYLEKAKKDEVSKKVVSIYAHLFVPVDKSEMPKFEVPKDKPSGFIKK